MNEQTWDDLSSVKQHCMIGEPNWKENVYDAIGCWLHERGLTYGARNVWSRFKTFNPESFDVAYDMLTSGEVKIDRLQVAILRALWAAANFNDTTWSKVVRARGAAHRAGRKDIAERLFEIEQAMTICFWLKRVDYTVVLFQLIELVCSTIVPDELD